jgi:hypothetical protein
MSTPEIKPKKTKMLNTKLLPIAAAVLIILALLFMATPLLRSARGVARNGNFIVGGGGQGGLPSQGGGTQTFPNQGGSNLPNRQFVVRGAFLAGATGAVVFFLALLVSLVAALGMLFLKRWGRVLGILMAVLYGLVGLISLVPILLLGSFGLRNPLSLILGIFHILLAMAVIVLASIPPKQPSAQAVAEVPPGAGG